MSRLYKLILIFFGLSTMLSAQNGIPISAGARGMAMGNTGVAFQNITSILSNQAGLAFIDQTAVFAFGERRFGDIGINNFAAGIAHPLNVGTFGLSFQYFGISAYKEQKIGLAYARKLFERVSIGAQFDYLNTSITDYGNKGVITFELGVQAEIIDNLILGVHLFSPMRVEIIEGENVPTLIKAGLAYKASKKAVITLEADQDPDQSIDIKGGVEYFIHQSLAIRIGGASNPSLATFGLGFRMENGLTIDVASTYHQILGFSPSFNISYPFGKKK